MQPRMNLVCIGLTVTATGLVALCCQAQERRSASIADQFANQQFEEKDVEQLQEGLRAAQSYAREVAGSNDAIYYEELTKSLLEINGKAQALRTAVPQPVPASESPVYLKFGSKFALRPDLALEERLADVTSTLPRAVRTVDMSRQVKLFEDKTWQANFGRMMALPNGRGLRAFGGSTGTVSEFKPCVAIGNAQGRFWGSGVLIGPNVVLTAAHVIKAGFDKKVFFGTNVREQDQGRVVKVKPDGAFPHASYKIELVSVKCGEESMEYQVARCDIGILILEEALTDVSPFPLASQAELAAHITKSGLLHGVGFGIAINTETGLFIPDGGVQTFVLLPIASAAAYAEVCDAASELVAGDGQRDTCPGDSGGPLLIESKNGDEKKYSVAAVVSRGLPCFGTCSGGGGVNTLAHSYNAWIRQTATANGGTLP